MSVDFDRVRADLAAFADDDEEIVIEKSGQCIFVRNGEELNIRLNTDSAGLLRVDYNDQKIPYRKFLSHELANLPILAERILTKRLPIQAYIDSAAHLDRPSERREGRGLELLAAECNENPPFSSRVTFITADAGQGKTALLRQFQHEQAKRFLANESPFVFWHVDLQGRQLLRLSEALMGDLGDLRVSGIWMPAIVRLLRYRVLVLAIDGFDELAAEQGASDALGALALLVQQVGDEGTIVAASRRTFFDTDDYIRKSRLFGRAGANNCEFDQMALHSWQPSDGRKYFSILEIDGKRFPNPGEMYDEVVTQLGQHDHPMVTRPYLLAQIARGLLVYNVTPADFIKGMDDPLRGVGAVVQAFVKREVGEKWRDKDTGEPFLTEDQHLELLANVAEEMFRAQRTTIETDVLETLATLLLDDWQIDQAQRAQILEMVRMHVLLTPPEGDFTRRKFDHEQFQDWFTAYALQEKLARVATDGPASLGLLLGVAHLSDATARYACALITRRADDVSKIILGLSRLLEHEWRPGYLQMNVGTLIPYLLDGVEHSDWIDVPAGALYSSLVFEESRLRRVRFAGGTFVNVSFTNVDWEDIVFLNCELGEVTFDKQSKYEGVMLMDCHIEGIRVLDSEETREYAPERIALVLNHLGVEVTEAVAPVRPENESERAAVEPPGHMRKHVQRVLNMFRRTTFFSESMIQNKFHRDAKRVLDDVLPLMESVGIIEPKPWKGSGGSQRAWSVRASIEDIEKADGNSLSPYADFWRKVDAMDARRRKP